MSFPSSFRAARWLRTTNLVLQAILFLTFFGGLNYLALLYSWRFDLTRLRTHSISAETDAYLKRLTQPVRVIVTFNKKDDDPNNAQAYIDASDLLREYVYATESRPNARITVEYIDVYQRANETRQLDLKANRVLFLCGDRRREIGIEELYEIKNQKRVAFLGEQAFTAAILAVSSTEQKRIYFLVGHGEAELDTPTPRGLSLLRDYLRSRNFALETIDLARARAIPNQPNTKPALIVSVGATSRYSPLEEELLRRYLSEDAGRLMVFTTPGVWPTGLDGLFLDWGLIADDVVIHDDAKDAESDAGELFINTYWPHEITKLLTDNKGQLVFGSARSIRPHPMAVADPGRVVSRLVGAGPTAWGERNYRKERKFSEGDLRGSNESRLSLAAASERLAAEDNLRFSVPVGRLVVFGSSDFISNERISDRQNAFLFFSALNWLVERDTPINVAPRKIDKFQLTLSSEELVRLRYSLLFGLPAAAALLGLIVYWTRRR